MINFSMFLPNESPPNSKIMASSAIQQKELLWSFRLICANVDWFGDVTLTRIVCCDAAPPLRPTISPLRPAFFPPAPNNLLPCGQPSSPLCPAILHVLRRRSIFLWNCPEPSARSALRPRRDSVSGWVHGCRVHEACHQPSEIGKPDIFSTVLCSHRNFRWWKKFKLKMKTVFSSDAKRLFFPLLLNTMLSQISWQVGLYVFSE